MIDSTDTNTGYKMPSIFYSICGGNEKSQKNSSQTSRVKNLIENTIPVILKTVARIEQGGMTECPITKWLRLSNSTSSQSRIFIFFS